MYVLCYLGVCHVCYHYFYPSLLFFNHTDSDILHGSWNSLEKHTHKFFNIAFTLMSLTLRGEKQADTHKTYTLSVMFPVKGVKI